MTPTNDVAFDDQSWSDRIGALAADALVDAGLVPLESVHLAAKIIAQEAFVRLCIGDKPKA